MLKRTVAFIGAIVLALSVGGTAIAGGHHHVAELFVAAGTGQVSFDLENPRNCPVGTIGVPATEVVNGQVRAVGLGRYGIAATHCPTPAQSLDGLMTITARNGDRIEGTYTNNLAWTDTTVTVTGWMVVTGGTGRYAHAQGRIWQHHVVSLDTLQVDLRFAGLLWGVDHGR